MRTDFKDAEAGDHVWDVLCGWGKITIVESNQIHVEFQNGYTYWYNRGGDRYTALSAMNRSLYWNVVILNPPERSKIKKKFWVNFIRSAAGIPICLSVRLYDTEQDAIQGRQSVNMETVPIDIEV